jgi:hypothetical protein
MIDPIRRLYHVNLELGDIVIIGCSSGCLLWTARDSRFGGCDVTAGAIGYEVRFANPWA